MSRIVIIGATSAIASEFAKQISSLDGVNFVLVGRDSRKLQIQANDLLVRNPKNTVDILSGNLESSGFVSEVVARSFERGAVDKVLIAQGSLPLQVEIQESPQDLSESISINAVSPAMFADAFALRLNKQDQASVLAIIGSVAGDRGRKTNYSYGASKSFINTFARGLQHRLHKSNVCVLLIKPGPVDTPMTAHLRAENSGMASKDQVAKEIIEAIQKRKSTLYTPKKWALIMSVIRFIPASIFNRLNL